MLEYKQGGIIITDSPLETAWFNFAENTKQEIQVLESKIARAERDLKVGQREVYQKFRAGAKKQIEQCKETILIHKELLALAESKLKRKV